jgi:hypothetical protein
MLPKRRFWSVEKDFDGSFWKHVAMLTNTNARNDTDDFVFGFVRVYLSKILARWVNKDTNARNDTTMRCFVFRIGFVKYWQDGFTPIQTHATTRRCVALFFGFGACVSL